jgi:NADH-quinone oxidoreductase subunit M
MILPWLVIGVAAGGIVAWAAARIAPVASRVVSLGVLAALAGVVLALWVRAASAPAATAGDPWLVRWSIPWIPSLHVAFAFGLDGVGLLLLALTSLLGLVAVAASWSSVDEGVGFFHFNLLAVVAALVGVFTATDLFLFYVFWEVLLVPLYFLIALWGYVPRRTYAAVKFFLFTQASGLLLLLAILGLHFAHERATGVSTFDYFALLGTPLPPSTALPLMLGFFVAFAVKLPVVGLHTWLPDAHGEAPTAGSVHLAGLVLKVGAYGLLRFTVPLFPAAAARFAPVAMALGVAGILYGALVAYGQTDLKRLVAYTSVSHMGFVLVGVFAWTPLALQGALVVMLAHGVSTSALFVLAGDLSARLHTRDLSRMGGLWATAPRMGGFTLLFALASLGLPGLGNFVGEILVLVGTWRVSPAIAAIGTTGFVVATVYSLALVQRVFLGPNTAGWKIPDSTPREVAILAALTVAILWLGTTPRPTLDLARRAIDAMSAGAAIAAAPSAPRTDGDAGERGTP